MERVIAERPEAGFLPVDIDTGFAHGSVKNQCSLFAGGNGKGGAIPAYAYIRQSAVRPVFTEACFSKFCVTATFCKSLSRSNGP